MKKVKIILLWLLLGTIVSCKKAEKIEIEKPTNRIVSTIAGAGLPANIDGTAQRSAFRSPQKIATDAKGNIYVADMKNHSIRKITPEGMVSTVAGNGERGYADGTGTTARFNQPFGIELDANGNIYVADSGNNCIRKITPSGVVTTLAGAGGESGDFADGTGTDARFNYPFDLVVDRSNNIFVADINNHRIRKITPTGVVTTFVGNGETYLQDGPIETATMLYPGSLTIDLAGNMYVSQSSFIRKITPEGIVSVLAGNTDTQRGFGYVDGAGLGAKFFFIYDITTDKKGNINAADADNSIIRKITPDGFVSTHAGIRYVPDNSSVKHQDGPAAQSYFARPQGITIDGEGNIIVAEADGNRIRKISEIPIPDSPEEIARKNWNKPEGWK